ncbi:MAG: ECF-type sigma factor [Phycisphaerales bacterium]
MENGSAEPGRRGPVDQVEAERLRAADLFGTLQSELRDLAGMIFAQQSVSHTLQPTALVNEVWLKLSEVDGVEDRAHFLALAARAMRQVLADHARAKSRSKRGGGAIRLTLNESHHADQRGPAGLDADLDLVAFSDALDQLARLNERHAAVAEYRLLGSLSIEEIARLLGVSEKTIKRDWQTARLWLLNELLPR